MMALQFMRLELVASSKTCPVFKRNRKVLCTKVLLLEVMCSEKWYTNDKSRMGEQTITFGTMPQQSCKQHLYCFMQQHLHLHLKQPKIVDRQSRVRFNFMHKHETFAL